jgi:elongator complex protein 2
MHTLTGHDNWVRDLSFATYTSSDDEETTTNNLFQNGDLILASGSQDKYIRLWKISAHVPLSETKSEDPEIDTELSEALKATEL